MRRRCGLVEVQAQPIDLGLVRVDHGRVRINQLEAERKKLIFRGAVGDGPQAGSVGGSRQPERASCNERIDFDPRDVEFEVGEIEQQAAWPEFGSTGNGAEVTVRNGTVVGDDGGREMEHDALVGPKLTALDIERVIVEVVGEHKCASARAGQAGDKPQNRCHF